MAINLESHGLQVAAAYGAPATVQEQQGDGHGQQAFAQDAGYSPASAFEQAAGASVAHGGIQDLQAAGGNDLLSKLGGFIRAVGDVMVQLGEYIRGAGGALGDALPGQAAPAAPQAPLGTPNGAPAPTAPGAPVPQQVLAGPQANTAATLAAPPRQTNPSQNARPAAPATADASRTAQTGSVGAPATDLSAAAPATPRGARSTQSSGYPVLNPLPAYLGDQLGFFNFDSQPQPAAAQPPEQGFEATLGTSGFEGFQGFEASFGSAEPEATPLPENASVVDTLRQASQDQIAQVAGLAALEEGPQGVNNVIPFPGSDSRDAFAGEASNDVTGSSAQQAGADLGPRYSAVVFRPAFYGNLRC